MRRGHVRRWRAARRVLADARLDARLDRPGERFVTPLSVPAPWRFRRFYFLFGEPIATNGVDAADKAACDALYGRVRRSLEADLAYLLRQRENDPYEPFLPRVAVEASWNWTRTVPSFPLG